MQTMEAMAMPHMHAWTAVDALLALGMWSVMMVAMMAPSAAPMVLTYDRLRGTRATAARATPTGATRTLALRVPRADTAAFVAGYFIVWAGFSVGAAALQWALHTTGLLAPDMLRVASALGGALLVVAGVWQLTPLKHACLVRCRTPLSFLMTEWRDGTAGALAMGLRHGLWCVGCCWALMLVLFAAGIMSLAWIALLAAWVLVEKTMPAGDRIARVGGVLAIGWGGWLIARGL